MRIGSAQVDFDALIIDRPDSRVTMEPIVMKLLKVLADNPNKVMSRDELITAVWGVEYGGDERLSRGISLLRKALGDTKAPRQYIETISRRGYRLIATIDDSLEKNASDLPISDSSYADVSRDDNAQNIFIPKNLASETPISRTPNSKMSSPDPVSVSQPVAAHIKNKTTKYMGFIAALLLVFVAIGSLSVKTINTPSNIPVNARVDDGLNLVENFHQDGAIEQAKNIFNRILAKDPDHAAARAGLAIALLREYTWIESDPSILQLATAHAEAALRADEHLALANIARAWVSMSSGNFDEAHTFLDRADILDADNKQGLEVRVRTFAREGQIEKAQTRLSHAVKIYPDVALFHIIQGGLSEVKGDFQQSEIAFRKAITLSTNNPNIYAQLAQALHLQDRSDEAIKTIQEGLKVRETALLYSNLGAYLFFQRHYDLAASAFEKTLEIGGDTHSYLYWSNLADAYRWTPGREKDAKIAYKRAIQLLKHDLEKNPNSSDFNTRSAIYHAKSGDFKGAQQVLSKVSFSDGMPPVQYYRSAVVYEIIADRKQALTLLDKAVKSGYPLNEIKHDPELAELRQDITYHKLLAEFTQYNH